MFSRPYHPDRFFAPRYFPSGVQNHLGYRVYHRETPTAARSLVASIAPGTSQFTLDELAAYSTGQYEVRAVSRCGVEDIEPLRLVKVVMDDEALYAGPVPNAPLALQVTPLAGGYVKATWSYIAGGQAATPGSFEVRTAVLPAAIDYDDDADVTVVDAGLRSYSATLGPFDNGDIVSVNVQAVASSGAGGARDGNRLELAVLVDAAAPASASYIYGSATASR